MVNYSRGLMIMFDGCVNIAFDAKQKYVQSMNIIGNQLMANTYSTFYQGCLHRCHIFRSIQIIDKTNMSRRSSILEKQKKPFDRFYF